MRHGVVANPRGVVAKLGINVTESAPNGVATSTIIAASPKRSIVVAVVTDHALSGMGLSPNSVGSLPSSMASSLSGRASSPKHGVVVTEHAPSRAATLPRLALLPERSILLTERAPSGVRLLQGGMASLLSGMVLSPVHCIVVVVTTINNNVTMK